MRLRDPDGAVVATNSGRSLKFHVDARQLDKSRAADGGVRNWTLEVVTGANSAPHANVYGANQITVQTLQSRIDTLIGAGGSKIDIYGENVGGRARARIRIKDELSAETVDMHGLLDSLIKDNPQDADVNRNHPDIRVNTPYTIADRSEDYSGLRIVVADVKVKKISISLGASQRITPSIPAARILLETQGAIKIKIGGLTLATIKIRDNRLELEAGLTIDSDGKVAVQSWVSERLLDGDLHWTTAIISAIASAGIATAVAFGVVEYMEHEFNERIREGIKEAIESSVGRTPQILAMLNGADLTFRSVGLDGNNVRFEHIAPIEPDPKPSKIYKGIIGRSYTQLGPDAFSIMPPTMGDTWAQDNLQKIEHIVVVMMENRSFDHVLGHRSQAPDSSGIDGLSQPLIDHLGAAGFPIGKLRDSAFDFKTQFPLSVEHELHDVTTQVQHTMADQNGNLILSPKGFVDNFVENHRSLETATPGAKVNKFDVLGYYEGADLPFYRYLADNYTYCDRYYCSHPGPTLPNRMFSLVGDVQYDRVGEAIVDNNDGDNFYLSRALSIYDVLNRKGIDWRVYESYPSVTMLRMFARYATDDQKIVNINRLSADVAAGNLPPLTVVEPAMHHYPQNDDHPVADMINGQAFLKGVYDTLRSNDALWQKTLLVITYDEHGGFYDHVIPPTADLRAKRQIDMASDEIDTRGGGGRPVTSTNPSTTSTSIPRRGGLGDVLAGFPTDIFETPAATPPPPFINPVCATKFGVRVPTFLVSPWVPSGCAPDLVFDHCSILKTILARFVPGKSPFMTDRVASSRSFNALLTEATPRSVGPRRQSVRSSADSKI
ncbi:MAG: alkaline phosphatase family protein [Sphingomonadales bacterium]|nr:alkaline phosphatase family protein [Sphingomonadales bacterium]